MKSTKAILLILLLNGICLAQLDTSIWSDLKTITKDYYELSAPSKWREMDMSAYDMEVYFEASGKAFPITYDGGPFIVILSLVKTSHNSLDEAKESIQRGYSQNKDRVFPENFEYESESLKLSSGEDAYLINTRFYRKSKNLYQSRFDLAAYSDKNKVSYMYTISIQYNDSSFKVEENYKLKDFARKTFSYFKFR